jgi:hypothetical protein
MIPVITIIEPIILPALDFSREIILVVTWENTGVNAVATAVRDTPTRLME